MRADRWLRPLKALHPAVLLVEAGSRPGWLGRRNRSALCGTLFNRFYRVKLPPYLGFFAGKRSVPLLTAFAAIGTGILLSLVWPPIGRGIDAFSHWAATGNPAAAFSIYGPMNRSKRDCRCYCTSSAHRWPRWRPWPVH
jgi:phosphotransferase system  glucose/maltose/N-acetylglucosamine-specific IIC component